MRLLTFNPRGGLSLTEDLDIVPRYAILSHTWGPDRDEMTFADIKNEVTPKKVGYAKLEFCAEQARKDNIDYFWVDTCCINKDNLSELSEAITSMFRWYRDAAKCYVYLADVSVYAKDSDGDACTTWETSFRRSRWFTRGWTLQELLAPKVVEFFSQERIFLGSKTTLVQQIHEITGIPKPALEGTPLLQFSVSERMRWAARRQTTKPEDKAYSLLGIFEVYLPFIYGERENAFFAFGKQLTSDMLIRVGASEKSIHTHWCVPRSSNPLFTGREELLQELEYCVRDALSNPWNGAPCQIAISGMGGQGKSEICLQLARRLRHMFWAVLWVDISTKDSAERSFLDMAEKLSIPAQSWEDARHGIANLKNPWLLVLDNADEPDFDYQDYFPDGQLGVIMLTTRNTDCQQYGTTKSISLDGLENSEARELLLRSARVPRHRQGDYADDAQIVATLFQGHALALIQAGAYVSRGHCTLGDYPRVYEERRRQLLAFRPSQAQSRYRDVYTTFEVSVNTLQTLHTEAAQDALQLLPLLAICGPSRLPQILFEAAWKGVKNMSPNTAYDAVDDEMLLLTPWHSSHVPPFLGIANAVWSPFRLVEALSILKAFSLISTDDYDGSLRISMHPLVHAWAWDRQGDKDQLHHWLQMGCVVSFALVGGALSHEHERWLQLHVEALMVDRGIEKALTSGPPVLITRIIMQCGWYLQRIRADSRLFKLIRKLLGYLALDLASVKQPWVGLYNLAASNLVDYGKPKEAVVILNQVVQLREQIQADDHPDRLASQHALAMAYEANGQVKEAVALLEKVVNIREQIQADDHPDRLASQHELARAYRANGQVKEAVALLEKVVNIREQILADDHPSRLASQHELAGAYEANGQVKEAVALLEKVVNIREQILADDHPSRLASQHELARAYRANGQVKEAVALLEKVVNIREQILADDHPSRLASQHELAGAYEANGQVKEAVALLEKVVNIREQIQAEDHPDRLASQHELARAYRANGQVKEAVALLEKVVKIREQIQADDHPDRLASLHNLATFLWTLGERQAPLSIMIRVVEIQRHVMDTSHPARKASEAWLSHFREEMDNM